MPADPNIDRDLKALGEYTSWRDRLRKMPEGLYWYYIGWIEGVMYAFGQTNNLETVTVDAPATELMFDGHPFDPQEFLDVLRDLDDGGIIEVHMWVVRSYGRAYVKMEFACTENTYGIPDDWDRRQGMTPEEIREALLVNQK